MTTRRRNKAKAATAPHPRRADKPRPKSAVAEYVALAGGVRRVCFTCDVAQATVYLWLRAGYVPYLRHALRLSRAARKPVAPLAGPESTWRLKS